MILILFLVSLFTFAAFNVLPGDPAALILGTEATQEQLEALRHELGIDKSLPAQYFGWLGGLFTGSLGVSIKYHKPVSEMVAQRLPVTFWLSLMSITLALIIAVPLSLLAAARKNKAGDKVISTGAAVGMSIPEFFIGVIIIWIFGIVLKWFTPGLYVPISDDPRLFFKNLFYPALTIAIPNAAMVVRFLRASLVSELSSDYVRTARSKGSLKGRVLFRHALKNAAIPAVTLLGMIVGGVFSGSIIVEKVFTLPGIGLLLISSITSRDLPLVQTLVMYIAAIVVVVNMAVDIIIQIIDPRIRVG
jgi:ABC-type dipeptide/oligopeptide/nickel transport system permease component